jgi:CelD/BcsL family acetyltransferase involved in cellulose biosynthesis
MKISRIDDIHQFDQLKTGWEAVYSADSHAHIFVSWTWLRGWFEMTPYTWSVLAVRPDDTSPYVAFFPLIMRGPRIYQWRPIRMLHMGGQPLAAYTGFVCLPEYEEEALGALALYVQQQLGWDSFQMKEVLDPRLDFFLQCFPEEKFDVRQSHGMPSLYIPLPDNWDQYLQDFLGSKTRRNLRRSFRRIEGLDEFGTTRAQEDNLERDIEVLFTLWQWRWGPKPMAHWHRRILHHYSEHDRLCSTVLWDGATPLAALAAIVDRQKKTLYAYIVGHNAKFAKLSPGKAVIGYSIRSAIENGFQVFDFLAGADAYKFSFGAKQRGTKNVIITRKGLRSTVASTILNLARRSGESLVKILGKTKRIGIVKKIWFWLRNLVKR